MRFIPRAKLLDFKRICRLWIHKQQESISIHMLISFESINLTSFTVKRAWNGFHFSQIFRSCVLSMSTIFSIWNGVIFTQSKQNHEIDKSKPLNNLYNLQNIDLTLQRLHFYSTVFLNEFSIIPSSLSSSLVFQIMKIIALPSTQKFCIIKKSFLPCFRDLD